MAKPELEAMIKECTGETPPKGDEINIIPRDWGYKIEFLHNGKIERMDVATKDDAAIRQWVATRKAQLAYAKDNAAAIRKAYLMDRLAILQSEIKEIEAELAAINQSK